MMAADLTDVLSGIFTLPYSVPRFIEHYDTSSGMRAVTHRMFVGDDGEPLTYTFSDILRGDRHVPARTAEHIQEALEWFSVPLRNEVRRDQYFDTLRTGEAYLVYQAMRRYFSVTSAAMEVEYNARTLETVAHYRLRLQATPNAARMSDFDLRRHIDGLPNKNDIEEKAIARAVATGPSIVRKPGERRVPTTDDSEVSSALTVTRRRITKD